MSDTVQKNTESQKSRDPESLESLERIAWYQSGYWNTQTFQHSVSSMHIFSALSMCQTLR